jgi:hypothetical protein
MAASLNKRLRSIRRSLVALRSDEKRSLRNTVLQGLRCGHDMYLNIESQCKNATPDITRGSMPVPNG